jgi:hypothetical protein
VISNYHGAFLIMLTYNIFIFFPSPCSKFEDLYIEVLAISSSKE